MSVFRLTKRHRLPVTGGVGVSGQVGLTIPVGTAVPVTSLTVNHTVAGPATQPFTVGQVFKKTDIGSTDTITLTQSGSVIPHQVDIRNRWSDGSVRFAVLSGVSAQGTVTVNRGGTGHSAANVAEPAITASVAFSNATLHDGTPITIGTAGLSTPLAASTWRRDIAHKVREILGPVMSEFHYFVPTPDAHTHVWFYVRAYSTGQTEVETVVENGWFNVASPGRRNYRAAVTIGGTVRYDSGASPLIQHYHHTRWSRVDWVNEATAPNVVPKHDVAYLQTIDGMPKLAVSTLNTTAYTTLPQDGSRKYSSWNKAAAEQPAPFDIANSNIRDALTTGGTANMGTGGYTDNANVFAPWDMTYLAEGNAGAYWSIQGNTRHAGRYCLHYRDETTGGPARGSQYPTTFLNPTNVGIGDNAGGAVQTPAPSGGEPSGTWVYSHAPSLGYFAYLTSGRWTALEELQFICSTADFLQNSYNYGGFNLPPWDNLQVRVMAWIMRDKAQAAIAWPEYLKGATPTRQDDIDQRTEAVGRLNGPVDYYHASFVTNTPIAQSGRTPANTRPRNFYNNPFGLWYIEHDHWGSGDNKWAFSGMMLYYLSSSVTWAAVAEATSNSNLTALGAFTARFPVGMLGAAPGSTTWDWRFHTFYSLSFATAGAPNFNVPTYASWDAQWTRLTTQLSWTPTNPAAVPADNYLYGMVDEADSPVQMGQYTTLVQGQYSHIDAAQGAVAWAADLAAKTTVSGATTAASRYYGSTTWANAIASDLKNNASFAYRSKADYTLPYSLPASGAALMIPGTDTNNAMTIAPAAMPNGWNRALFQSYGTGTFVPGYSAAGAYVIAGSGGHGHPSNIGAAIFDFQMATWTRKDPQGGDYRTGPYYLAELSGAPTYEINGSGGVPAPVHPYSTLCPVPASVSLPNGGAVYISRGSIASESTSTYSVYQVNLSTGVWSRLDDNTVTPYGAEVGFGANATYDEGRNRYWLNSTQPHSYDWIAYFDPATSKYVRVPFTTWPAGDPVAITMFGTYVVGRGASGYYWLFDPDTPLTGWQQITNYTGTPALLNTSPSTDRQNELPYFPPSGCFYGLAATGGNTLVRVRPHATTPKTGAWHVDTVTVSGPTLPPHQAAYGSAGEHYGRALVYVPGLQRLAWIPGTNNGVYLIHPGS